jgi:hypothetical protein
VRGLKFWYGLPKKWAVRHLFFYQPKYAKIYDTYKIQRNESLEDASKLGSDRSSDASAVEMLAACVGGGEEPAKRGGLAADVTPPARTGREWLYEDV